MKNIPHAIDVVILGAGAAGIAAARFLRTAGADCLVLEARERAGGRAHTLTTTLAPLDMGCEWLHSANVNPLVAFARKQGFTVEEDEPDWSGGLAPNFSPEDRAAFRRESQRFWDRLEEAAKTEQSDAPAANYLDKTSRWNGLINAISTYYNGVELEKVSVADLGRYEDTGVNWKITEGYGAMIASAAADLPIVFRCQATKIDHSGQKIEIETKRGAIKANAVIVTLPTNVLASGGLRFFPGLPDKIAAAAALPLGLANKVFFALENTKNFPQDVHAFGATDRVETISFDLRPKGLPLISGFIGGAFARALERQGPGAMEAEARRQLGQIFGAQALQAIRFLTSTAWDADPYAQGAYSHALPGYANQRATLAAPVNDRLFFAGEACSAHRFSTAHGAWETGEAAAKALLSSRPPQPV